MMNSRFNSIGLIILTYCLLMACGANKENTASVSDSKNEVKSQKISIAETLRANDHRPVEERIPLAMNP